jgi:hypothetical protein
MIGIFDGPEDGMARPCQVAQCGILEHPPSDRVSLSEKALFLTYNTSNITFN